MRTLLILLDKEFRQFIRNSFLPKVALIFPLMIMLVMPWVMTLDVRHIGIAVIDNDRTGTSDRLIRKIDASDYFSLVSVPNRYEMAFTLLEKGEVDVIIEVPDKFEQSILLGNPKKMRVTANGVNALKGNLGSQYAVRVLIQTLTELQREQGINLSATEYIVAENRYNPTLEYRNYMIPALMIIIPILSQADMGFRNLVSGVLEALGEDMWAFLGRCIVGILLGSLMFGTLYGGVYKRHVGEEECIRFHEESGRVFRFVPDTAVLTFGVMVSAVYVLFISLQTKYLFSAFFGILPEAYTYSEYARQGFFELCVIALLNASFLIAMNGCAKTPRKDSRGLILENLILGALTLLLLTTAASKLGMYIVAYGFTVKRCISLVFLIWLFLVFILVLCCQKKEIPLVRWSVFAGAVLFTLLCVLPVEQLVALIPYHPVS